MANRPRRTSKKDERFFSVLANGGSVTKAAKAAGYARRSVYEWRDADEEFREGWDEALEAGTDLLEDEAMRRAMEGISKPVGFHLGVHGGTFVREYSDTLTIVMLKARRPEKFKERVANEHSGPDGGPIEVGSPRDRIASRIAQLAERKGSADRS